MQGLAVIAIVAVMQLQVLLPAFRETTFGISVNEARLVIRDMAAHLTFVRQFWIGGADYTVESHLRITSQWAGRTIDRALPFGYSPTMLLVLAPLAALPIKWGFALWTLLGGAAIWWMCRRGRTVFVFGVMLLLSPLALLCLALGQTGILSGAGLVFLMLRDRRRTECVVEQQWSWHIVPDGLVLFALTAKPPLALVAGIALLAERRWKTVVTAGALTAATLLWLTPRLGTDWINQYFSLLSHYDRETADAAFAWSLRPDLMTNLRAVLLSSGFVGDHLACNVSTTLWALASMGVLAAGLAGRLGRGVACVLAVFAYLLFCPHLSSTEDLHLVLLPAFLGSPQLSRAAFISPTNGSPQQLTAEAQVHAPFHALPLALRYALCLAIAVVFLPPDVTMPAGALRSGLLFSFKVIALACFIWAMASRNRQPRTGSAVAQS